MKAKVIIENGLAKIVLTPEFDFETQLIKNINAKNINWDISTQILEDYNFGEKKNNRQMEM